MKGSRIAMYIERDIKTQQAYERKQREKCKEKSCIECKYIKICGGKK